MTTPDFRPRDFTPRLDRQITREVTTTTTTQGGADYTWADELTVDIDPQDGLWRRPSDTQLVLSASPSTGGPFPSDLEAPVSGVEVSFDDGAATSLTITAIAIKTHFFTFAPLVFTLDFDGDLPASGEVLKIRLPGGQDVEVTTTEDVLIWAQRRDFSWRDFSQLEQGSLLTIQDTRYVVRAESGPWAAGDTFTNEDGVTLHVQGVQQLGRQYLELLSRSGGL